MRKVAKADDTVPSSKYMTLVVDDTDLLVFMLCRVVVTNCTGQGDIECL